MENIGIDVHKVSTHICVLTETGEDRGRGDLQPGAVTGSHCFSQGGRVA